MTYQQRKAALEISHDREERYAEMEWRQQLELDRKARELRAENARRMARAMNRH